MQVYLIITMFLIIFNVSAETILSGTFHGSIDYIDDGRDTNGLQVSSNLSQLNISGNEEISNNISIIYNLTNTFSFSSQDGDATIADCNTYVGIATKAGEFSLGRVYSAFDDVLGEFNLFAGQVGDLNIISDNTGLAPCQSDAISYTTPDLNGFSARLTYAPDETDNSINGDVFSASGFFRKNNFTLGLGYESLKEEVTGGEQTTGFRFGAGYNFNNGMGINVFYQLTENIAGLKDIDGSAYAINFSYAFNRNTLKLGYYGTDNDGNDTDAQAFTIALDHSLSEQTTVYAALSILNNEDFADFAGDPYSVIGGDHGDVGIGALAGETQTALSFGIIVNF